MKTYLPIILLTLLSNLAYSFTSEFFEERLKLAQQGDTGAQQTVGSLSKYGIPTH